MQTIANSPFQFYRRLALLTTAVIFAAALGAANSYAHDEQRSYDADDIAEEMTERLDDYLDFSDAQEEQIEDILTDSMKQRRQLRQARHNQMQALWNKPTLTAEEIRAAITQHHSSQSMQAMREANMALAAETLAKIHAVLTPAQRQKVAGKGMMHWLGIGHHRYGGRLGGGGYHGGQRGHGGWFGGGGGHRGWFGGGDGHRGQRGHGRWFDDDEYHGHRERN